MDTSFPLRRRFCKKERRPFLFGLHACVLLLTGTLAATAANAQSDPDLPPNPACVPGVAAGTGTHFAITHEELLDVTLDSADSVSVHLQSGVSSIALTIWQHAPVSATRLTLSRLAPLTTYYISVDDLRNPMVMVSSADSVVVWDQDVTVPHTIFIGLTTHTITLDDNGLSSPVGTWDPVTRTATLTQNVAETIQIVSSNITLDGGNFTISVPNSEGIIVQGTGIHDVTIRSVRITNAVRALYARACRNLHVEGVVSLTATNGFGFEVGDDGVEIRNCILQNGYSGIYASQRSSGGAAAPYLVEGSVFQNITQGTGLQIDGVRALYTIRDNTFQGNMFNFFCRAHLAGFERINLTGQNIADGRPILYFNRQQNLVIDPQLDPAYDVAAL